jgi:hypothetical protein
MARIAVPRRHRERQRLHMLGQISTAMARAGSNIRNMGSSRAAKWRTRWSTSTAWAGFSGRRHLVDRGMFCARSRSVRQRDREDTFGTLAFADFDFVPRIA